MASFGQWLRELRKKKGMTQEQLADASGLSPSYVSTLEREQPHSITGAKITPEREKVIALAKAVGGDSVQALLLCGYSATLPPNDASDNFEIAENVRVSMLHGKHLNKRERESLERSLAMAYEIAMRNLEAEKQNEAKDE